MSLYGLKISKTTQTLLQIANYFLNAQNSRKKRVQFFLTVDIVKSLDFCDFGCLKLTNFQMRFLKIDQCALSSK